MEVKFLWNEECMYVSMYVCEVHYGARSLARLLA